MVIFQSQILEVKQKFCILINMSRYAFLGCVRHSTEILRSSLEFLRPSMEAHGDEGCRRIGGGLRAGSRSRGGPAPPPARLTTTPPAKGKISPSIKLFHAKGRQNGRHEIFGISSAQGFIKRHMNDPSHLKIGQ